MLEKPAAEAQVTKQANSDSQDGRGLGRIGLPEAGTGLGSVLGQPRPPFAGEAGRVERCPAD